MVKKVRTPTCQSTVRLRSLFGGTQPD
jgi:hypothetical protein